MYVCFKNWSQKKLNLTRKHSFGFVLGSTLKFKCWVWWRVQWRRWGCNSVRYFWSVFKWVELGKLTGRKSTPERSVSQCKHWGGGGWPKSHSEPSQSCHSWCSTLIVSLSVLELQSYESTSESMQSPGQSSFFPSDNLSVHLFHQFNDRSLPPSYYSCLVKTSHPLLKRVIVLKLSKTPIQSASFTSENVTLADILWCMLMWRPPILQLGLRLI